MLSPILAVVVLLGAGVPIGSALAQEEPPLPPGLGTQEEKPTGDEPALPPGLGGGTGKPPAQEEPALPPGLESPPPPGKTAPEEAQSEPGLLAQIGGLPRRFGLDGFAEFRLGVRTQDDPDEKDVSIGEARLQLEFEEAWKGFNFKLKSDFLYDQVPDSHEIDLETGEGWIDLREASVGFTPLDFLDVKVGRQVLTWGTGDLLFLNDLFPKDWVSFFIGRDTEYLKAPSDALKTSLFTDIANLDVVYTPRFDADRFITGERLSYYNPLLGQPAGRDAELEADVPDEWFRDDEWAARLSRNLQGVELAAYGYLGRWKSPSGFDPATGDATFPKLAVWGASARAPFESGIANAETAWYDSRDDRSGSDPFVANSQVRFLVGYERQLPELIEDFTVGGQYYLEWMLDHDAYEDSLPPDTPEADEFRHVVTLRLSKLLLDQDLTLSLFTYYSPSDADAYLRPNIRYKIDDHWITELGGNVFVGRKDSTFFGQFEDNTNIFASLRYGF
jgi:hypothetical protein